MLHGFHDLGRLPLFGMHGTGVFDSILFSDLVMLAKRASYVLLNQYMISVLPFLPLIRYRSKNVFSVLSWGI